MLRVLMVAGVLVMLTPASASQNQSVDALRNCLADSTSGKDRKDLAKWVFLAMAAHPEMRAHAAANHEVAMEDSSKAIAALTMRLLTQSCLNETRAVARGGQVVQSMEAAFASLGQLAMQELMADKAVSQSMGMFERHLDQKRLSDAFSGGK